MKKPITSEDVVRTFIEFFERHDHLHIPLAPLVPQDDPTLLYINSGMAPLKPYFLGEKEPPRRELCNVQPCVRTKDIEDVGDRHHLTLFEMMGSWSVGGYWKRQAITLAYSLLVEGFGYDPGKLYATVYSGSEDLGIEPDEESLRVWEELGLASDHLVPLGEDNFWGPPGEFGPCGPCTEVFFDTGSEYGPAYEPGGHFDTDNRYIEIWNAGVFMQYNKQPNGLSPLALKSIDTGSGLERMVMVLNGLDSVYETDRMAPLVAFAADAIGFRGKPADSAEARLVADHLRATAFILAEGVTPSNVGRGYIPRRLIRKSLGIFRRYEKDLDIQAALAVILDLVGGAYPHIVEARTSIADVLRNEASDFQKVLKQGFGRLVALTQDDKPRLSSDEALSLFTTYGLPLDMIRDHLRDRGGELDEKGFEEAYRRHQAISRSGISELEEGIEERIRALAQPTVYVGDEDLVVKSGEVQAILVDGELAEDAATGSKVKFITDRTSFYAESGGQIGDCGSAEGSGVKVRIDDTTRILDGYFLHSGEVTEGCLRSGDSIRLEVLGSRRQQLRTHHSATHLLQATLRSVLGDHVQQAGSRVEPKKLRFDFTHPSKLTGEERIEIERRVNSDIQANAPADISIRSYDDAIASGAMAFFGDSYGEEVRVVRFGDISTELCGGSHVAATGDIGLFRIVSEGSIGSGVRRMVAVVGEAAVEYTQQREQILERLGDALGTSPENIEGRVHRLLKQPAAGPATTFEMPTVKDQAAAAAALPDGTRYVASRVDDIPAGKLRERVLELADAISGVAVLVGGHEGKAAVAVAVNKPLTDRFPANQILRQLLPHLEGRGGGKPHLAQGGGPALAGIERVLESFPQTLAEVAG